uniref:Uncharacterized protein n=1 Tax=Parascaris equorum TaxID=6256 RepID=A0A914RMJ9_PAREQ
MSAKAISEYTGKELLYRHLKRFNFVDKPLAIKLEADDNFDVVISGAMWFNEGRVK